MDFADDSSSADCLENFDFDAFLNDGQDASFLGFSSFALTDPAETNSMNENPYSQPQVAKLSTVQTTPITPTHPQAFVRKRMFPVTSESSSRKRLQDIESVDTYRVGKRVRRTSCSTHYRQVGQESYHLGGVSTAADAQSSPRLQPSNSDIVSDLLARWTKSS